jgi:L-lactate dehydrogenase complex protein LldG
MGSRNNILTAVKNNQPAFIAKPPVPEFETADTNLVGKYAAVLSSIGGKVFLIETQEQVIQILQTEFSEAKKIVSSLGYLAGIAENYTADDNPHSFTNVDLFIMESHLAVAENGAVWINDNEVKQRVLPFITQHLAVIINKNDIVATMHDAYNKIADIDYGFATFIAGPSKTADIEQSLVLGAHGARTMTVFVVG